MLVLGRKEGTLVCIGQDVSVSVLSARSGYVKLGIDAPKRIPIWRGELEWKTLPSEPSIAASNRASGIDAILVVEDNPGHAKIIRRVLTQSPGKTVTTASTAKQALAILGLDTEESETLRPDLILLDLFLEDSSGIEVLQAIRAEDKLATTPVIILSSSDDETVARKCLEAGANAYVIKGTEHEDFASVVGRIGQFWGNTCYKPHSEVNVGVSIDGNNCTLIT